MQTKVNYQLRHLGLKSEVRIDQKNCDKIKKVGKESSVISFSAFDQMVQRNKELLDGNNSDSEVDFSQKA